MLIGLVVPLWNDVGFDHVVFAFTGTTIQASPCGWKKRLDLLLISYSNIFNKKVANVQVKLTSLYLLEKDWTPLGYL